MITFESDILCNSKMESLRATTVILVFKASNSFYLATRRQQADICRSLTSILTWWHLTLPEINSTSANTRRSSHTAKARCFLRDFSSPHQSNFLVEPCIQQTYSSSANVRKISGPSAAKCFTMLTSSLVPSR